VWFRSLTKVLHAIPIFRSAMLYTNPPIQQQHVAVPNFAMSACIN